ncbi:MAG: hypothetical protein JJ957_20060 [Pseudomonadales bacterium]|nr:hypothetical protein [Pseudomonadales bacterium]
MIFAELSYPEHYSEVHGDIVNLLSSNFEKIEHGLQGDSWIWVHCDDEKVAIDSFTAMKHQVKCEIKNCELVDRVIQVLPIKYTLKRFTIPEFEPHE